MGGKKKKLMTSRARRLHVLKTNSKKKEIARLAETKEILESQTKWIRRTKLQPRHSQDGSSSRCIISNACLLQIVNVTCEHGKTCQQASFGDPVFLNGNIELKCTFCNTLFVASIDSGK